MLNIFLLSGSFLIYLLKENTFGFWRRSGGVFASGSADPGSNPEVEISSMPFMQDSDCETHAPIVFSHHSCRIVIVILAPV